MGKLAQHLPPLQPLEEKVRGREGLKEPFFLQAWGCL